MKLLIRNLARDTTEDDLRDMFEGYGKVQFCNLVLDKDTAKSKGFAFVEMPKQGEAKAAMKNLNGKHLDGNVIRVKKSEAKQEKVPVSEETEKADTTSAQKPPISPYRRK